MAGATPFLLSFAAVIGQEPMYSHDCRWRTPMTQQLLPGLDKQGSWLHVVATTPTITSHFMQVFYSQFGELMMRQPVIGLDFQSWMPLAIVPYMLMLVFNVFNRYVDNPWPLCSTCPCLSSMSSTGMLTTPGIVPCVLMLACNVFNRGGSSINWLIVEGPLCPTCSCLGSMPLTGALSTLGQCNNCKRALHAHARLSTGMHDPSI